jgi:hypothetical protein
MVERPEGSRRGALVTAFALCGGIAAAVLTLGAAACGSPPNLEATFESPAAVAQAVVDALERRDRAALERIAVNEAEFRDLVWPRQPAARPERNLPWDYVWGDLATKSRHQLRGRLTSWAPGRGLRVVSVAFTGDTTDYDTYRVMRKSLVTLRDAAGEQTTARLFGSIIEQNGRYKIFSYVVD